MDVLEELDKAGAVLLDHHFVYKSGKHGSGYINMDPLFTDPAVVYEICSLMMRPYAIEQHQLIDTVIAPAVGGIVLVSYAGLVMSQFAYPVATAWADKDGKKFRFERAGFTEKLIGKRVLVVEDLLTTGDSVLKVIKQAREHGAEIVGVSVVCNRGGVTAEQLGVPRLDSLTSVNFAAVDPDACELCQAGIPIVEDIGHGESYKADYPEYEGGYTRLLA